MSEIKLSLPNETLLALKPVQEAPAAEVRTAATVELYKLGRLSSGAAATLAGTPKPLFLTKLTDDSVGQRPPRTTRGA